MTGSCFAERLEKHIPLNEAERRALARLEETQRKIKRGAVIQPLMMRIPGIDRFMVMKGKVPE